MLCITVFYFVNTFCFNLHFDMCISDITVMVSGNQHEKFLVLMLIAAIVRLTCIKASLSAFLFRMHNDFFNGFGAYLTCSLLITYGWS